MSSRIKNYITVYLTDKDVESVNKALSARRNIFSDYRVRTLSRQALQRVKTAIFLSKKTQKNFECNCDSLDEEPCLVHDEGTVNQVRCEACGHASGHYPSCRHVYLVQSEWLKEAVIRGENK